MWRDSLQQSYTTGLGYIMFDVLKVEQVARIMAAAKYNVLASGIVAKSTKHFCDT